MPAADIWFGHRRCWQKRIASKDGNAALVAIRATRDRWEVSAQLETDTKPRQWLDYCEYRGGALDQETRPMRAAKRNSRQGPWVRAASDMRGLGRWENVLDR